MENTGRKRQVLGVGPGLHLPITEVSASCVGCFSLPRLHEPFLKQMSQRIEDGWTRLARLLNESPRACRSLFAHSLEHRATRRP